MHVGQWGKLEYPERTHADNAENQQQLHTEGLLADPDPSCCEVTMHTYHYTPALPSKVNCKDWQPVMAITISRGETINSKSCLDCDCVDDLLVLALSWKNGKNK